MSAGLENTFFEVVRIPSPVPQFTSNSRIGPYATLDGFYSFDEHWRLAVGLGVRQVRPNWSFEPRNSGGDYSLIYLLVPVVPTKRWFISVGLESSMLATDPPQDESWQRWDYGLTFGAGIKILPSLQFGLSYYLGVPRVAEGQFVEEQSPVTGVYYLKNRSVRARLTYSLPFGSH